jgi:mRNA-degrading endonuclease RelE of RelBE toxin-antitoxin system
MLIPAKRRIQVMTKIRDRLNQKLLPDGKISKKLEGVKTPDGHPVYRLRSGDYRVLYLIMSNQRVYVLDIVPHDELEEAIRRLA